MANDVLDLYRAENPGAFDDLSDVELADAIRSVRYPDMPFEEFSEAIGLPVERSMLGDIGAAAVSGIIGVPVMFTKAAKAVGYEDPNDFLGWLEETQSKFAQTRQGKMADALYQGVESIPQSLGVGLPGWIAGLPGYASMTGLVFGLAEYYDFMEEATALAEKNGIDPEFFRQQVKGKAALSALAEGGFEAVGEYTIGKVFKWGEGGVPLQGFKESFRKGLKDLAKQYTKRTAAVAAEEIPSEMATAAAQTALRNSVGMSDVDPLDAATQVIGPTAVASFGFGAVGIGMSALQHRLKEDKRTNDPLNVDLEDTEAAAAVLEAQAKKDVEAFGEVFKPIMEKEAAVEKVAGVKTPAPEEVPPAAAPAAPAEPVQEELFPVEEMTRGTGENIKETPVSEPGLEKEAPVAPKAEAPASPAEEGAVEPEPSSGQTQAEAAPAEPVDLAPEEDILLDTEDIQDESGEKIKVFRSGAEAVTDLKGHIDANVPLTVIATRVAKKKKKGSKGRSAFKALIDYASKGGHVLVDSGAFEVKKAELKYLKDIQEGKVAKPPKEIDFDKVLSRYEELANKASRTDTITFVAPDVIGDQGKTFELLKKYKKRIQGLINSGATVLMPVQLDRDFDTGLLKKGSLNAAESYLRGSKILGVKNIPAAIPSNESAFTLEDLKELLEVQNPPKRIHLLGTSPASDKGRGLGNFIKKKMPDVSLSFDATRHRALIGTAKKPGPITKLKKVINYDKEQEFYTGDINDSLKDLGEDQIKYMEKFLGPRKTWNDQSDDPDTGEGFIQDLGDLINKIKSDQGFQIEARREAIAEEISKDKIEEKFYEKEPKEKPPEKKETKKDRKAQFAEEKKRVYEDILSKRKASGRTKKAATSDATYWAAFVNAFAERYGYTPWEVYQKINPEVQGSVWRDQTAEEVPPKKEIIDQESVSKVTNQKEAVDLRSNIAIGDIEIGRVEDSLFQQDAKKYEEAPQHLDIFGSVNNRLSKELEFIENLLGPLEEALKLPTTFDAKGKKRQKKRSIKAWDLGNALQGALNSGWLSKLIDPNIKPEELAKERGLTGPELKKFLNEVKELRSGPQFSEESGKDILSTNGKATASVDLLLATCQPTTPCQECYAAESMIRASTVRKALRNTIYMLVDPKAFGQTIAEEAKKIPKTRLPFIRLLGSGDLTSSETIEAFNELAKNADRPIHIFSRHHDNLAKLKGTKKAPFIKMGSVDSQLYKHYGLSFLTKNGSKGINNAFLYRDEKELPMLIELKKKKALGLILSADKLLHVNLPIDLRLMSCPCDAAERSYMGSCRQCALSYGGCFTAFADKAIDESGKIWSLDDKKLPNKVAPILSFLQGQEAKYGSRGEAYADVVNDIVYKSVDLINMYTNKFKTHKERLDEFKQQEKERKKLFELMEEKRKKSADKRKVKFIPKEFKPKKPPKDNGEKSTVGITIKDLRFPDDAVTLIDKDLYVEREKEKGRILTDKDLTEIEDSNKSRKILFMKRGDVLASAAAEVERLNGVRQRAKTEGTFYLPGGEIQKPVAYKAWEKMAAPELITKEAAQKSLYQDGPQSRDAAEAAKQLFQYDTKTNTAKVRLPITLNLFNAKELQGKEGKRIKVETIRQIMNQKGVKKIEKEIVNSVLESKAFKGMKEIPYNDFRVSVEAELMPLAKIQTAKYSDYGARNAKFDYTKAISVVYNSLIPHGFRGHFPELFNRGMRKTYWEVVPVTNHETGETTFIAMDQDRPATRDPNILQNYVGTAGSRERVEDWIQEYNDNFEKNQMTSGLFGHVRKWFKGKDVYIAEVQSDYFQKNKPELFLSGALLENPATENMRKLRDRYVELGEKESDTKKAVKHAYRKALGSLANIRELNTEIERLKSEPDNPDTQRLLFNIEEDLRRNKEDLDRHTKGLNFYPDRYIELYRLITQKVLSVEEKNELRYYQDTYGSIRQSSWTYNEQDYKDYFDILKEKDRLTFKEIPKEYGLIYKQFAAYKDNHAERMIREEIRQAAQEGAEKLYFPTAYTASVIEGFITHSPRSVDGEASYTVLEGDPDNLLPGDRISFDGEEHVVFEVGVDGIEAAPISEMRILSTGEYFEEYFDDVWNDTFLDIPSDIILVKTAVPLEKQDFLPGTKKYYKEPERVVFKKDGIAYTWEIHDDQRCIGHLDENDITSSLNEYFNDKDFIFENEKWADRFYFDSGNITESLYIQLREKVQREFRDIDDIEAKLEREGEGFFIEDDTIYILQGATRVYPHPAIEEDEKREIPQLNFNDLSPDKQTIAKKYEELEATLKKMRPEVSIILDENGIPWYKLPLKDEDASAPVVVYQRPKEPKGSVNIFEEGEKPLVKLFEAADESTFLHESAHVFFQFMGNEAMKEGAPQELRNDWQTILDFVGSRGGPLTTDQHEKIARAMEAYFMEGKAPSTKLKQVFEKFKAWLKEIYQSIKGLNVELTNPVRNVMNRMFATDEEMREFGIEPEPQDILFEYPKELYQKVKGYKPKKTIKAYKLFRTLKTRPGEIFPLFIGKSKTTPIGEWLEAEFISTKGFADRPGWHAGVLPIAPHLRQASTGKIAPDRVWAEVEIPADRNWQKIADNSITRDIRDRVPKGGHYRFNTSKMQGGAWIIGGAIKVNRLLSDNDVAEILRENRVDEEEIHRELKGQDILYQTQQEPRNTETRAFRKWFGNSKVVDEDGKPLVVYHGSYLAGINAFEPNELGAIFFSSDKGTANTYAHSRDALYPVYLSIKNPFIVDAEGESFKEIIPSGYIGLAKSQGHDGVIVKNIKDDVSYEREGNTYIVFDPTQIKSIFNRGTFDPGNPDILYQTQQEPRNTETRAFRKWFGNSKVVDEDGKPLVVYHGTNADFDEFVLTEDGSFFSSSPKLASAYSVMGGKEGANVVPVYLKIENPLSISVKTWLNNINGDGIPLDELLRDEHDGIIIRKNPDHDDPLWRADTYVILESSTQIKSIFNRGTFDPGNPDILYQPRSGPVTADAVSDEEPFSPAEARASVRAQRRAMKEEPQRRKIIERFREKLNLHVGVGKAGKGLGRYDILRHNIRVRYAQDVRTVVREAGRHIQKLIGLTGEMPEEIQALAPESSQSKSADGFAEFVAEYVTNPQAVRDLAYTGVFEAALAPHTDIQDALVTARQMWNTYLSMTAVDRFGLEIVSYQYRRRLPTATQAYTAVKDALYPLQKLREAVEAETGQKLAKIHDPYVMATLVSGWSRKAETWLKWGRFKLDANEDRVISAGKSLKEILAPVEKAGRRHQLDMYLAAKRIANDPRQQKVYKAEGRFEDVLATVNEFESEFQGVAEELYDYSDSLLQLMVESGRMDSEVYAKIKEKNQFYAPLYRLMDNDPRVGGLSRKKYANLFSPVKTMKGSDRVILSPTESIIANTYAIMNVTERQKVSNALIKIDRMGGMGSLLHKLPGGVKPVKMSVKEAFRFLNQTLENMGGEPAELANVVDSLMALSVRGDKIKEVMDAQKQGMSEDEVEALLEEKGLTSDDLDNVIDTLVTFRANIVADPNKNQVILYNKGKPEIYEVPDTDLYNSIAGLDADVMPAIVKFLSFPAKMLRATATMTLEFTGRNVVRDQFTAFLTTKYGYVPVFDMLKGVHAVMAGRFESVRKMPGGEAAFQAYMKYNTSGAAHAALVSLDRNYIQRDLRKIINDKKSIPSIARDIITSPIQTLQLLSELSEEGTRVGEFMNVLKKKGEGTEGLLTGGFESKDLTLNFSRVGLKTRNINALISFWNARLEGLDKTVRAFKDQPVKTSLKVFAASTLPAVALFLAQEDDPYYQEIPNWRRVLFFNIVTHNEDGSLKRIWSIPKGFEVGILFGSFPEMFLQWWRAKDPVGFKAAAISFLGSLNPGVVPTAAVPLIEAFANRSYFFDRPLVPMNRLKNPGYQQYGPHTSETLIQISKAIASIPYMKETAPSPAKVENFIRGYSAGMGQMALDLFDSVTRKVINAPEPPAKKWEELPGVKGFSVRMPSAATRSMEDFYREKERMERQIAELRVNAGLEGMGVNLSKYNKKLQLYNMIDRTLKAQRNYIQTVRGMNIPAKVKRDVMDDTYTRMTNLVRTVTRPGEKPLK